MPNESETIAAARTSSLQRSHKRNNGNVDIFVFSNDTDNYNYYDSENHKHTIPPFVRLTKKTWPK